MAWWDELDGPILGRYRLERLLGEGGMARVFLATDVRADRQVAFKTPKIESFPPDSVKELLSRFNREFRSQASDPVQGVIPIYESGEFTDAAGVVRPFLAMQYLSGGSLGDLLGGGIGARAHRQTLAEVLEWLVPIARTVDRLHARKYLHRDIKPDNILFNSDGDAFLADFGIVGTLDAGVQGSTMAATGVLGAPGSPGYQPPESLLSDPALRNVSASDQFSLGVTVYEALAGSLPADAATLHAWIAALMHWTPVPLATRCPDLPAAAEAAVTRAIATQAFDRFTSCSEFAKALVAASLARPAGAAHGAPAADRASAPARPPAAAAAARRWLWPAALAVAVAALAVAVVQMRPRSSTTDSARVSSTVTSDPVAVPARPDRAPTVQDAPTAVATTTQPAASTPAKPAPEPAVVASSGRDTAPACATSDGDHDGVNDCLDTCRRTARGQAVGADGCPWPTAAPAPAVAAAPVKLDTRRIGFDSDSADLRPDATAVLDAVVQVLKQAPGVKVRVEGHTDYLENSPTIMSTARAQAAVQYLATHGVEGNRILGPTGVGADQPIAPNNFRDGRDDPMSRSLNRRVELKFQR